MTKAGHMLSGIGSGIIAFGVVTKLDGATFGFIAGFLAFLGATAPDWLEVPGHFWEKRLSLIPHRRITHWVLGWAILFGIGLCNVTHIAGASLFGFALGGLTHLLMDIPNPMGVPLIHPWRRTSLKLWASGEMELPLVILWTALACIALWPLSS